MLTLPVDDIIPFLTALFIFYWVAGHRTDIDVVAVPAIWIGFVKAEMRTINAHNFPTVQAAHIMPPYLSVAETEPPSIPALLDEFTDSAFLRCREERAACHRIMIGNLMRVLNQKVEPGPRRFEGIPGTLSKFSIKTADPVRSLEVDIKA